jgi:hypothetical protein
MKSRAKKKKSARRSTRSVARIDEASEVQLGVTGLFGVVYRRVGQRQLKEPETRKKIDRCGIRTHAVETISALN